MHLILHLSLLLITLTLLLLLRMELLPINLLLNTLLPLLTSSLPATPGWHSKMRVIIGDSWEAWGCQGEEGWGEEGRRGEERRIEEARGRGEEGRGGKVHLVVC